MKHEFVDINGKSVSVHQVTLPVTVVVVVPDTDDSTELAEGLAREEVLAVLTDGLPTMQGGGVTTALVRVGEAFQEAQETPTFPLSEHGDNDQPAAQPKPEPQPSPEPEPQVQPEVRVGRRAHRRAWEAEELNLLERFYRKLGAEGVQRVLKRNGYTRSRIAIISMAHKQGIAETRISGLPQVGRSAMRFLHTLGSLRTDELLELFEGEVTRDSLYYSLNAARTKGFVESEILSEKGSPYRWNLTNAGLAMVERWEEANAA